MKNLLLYSLSIVFLLTACKVEKKEEVKEIKEPVYQSFGEMITNENVMTKEVMLSKFSEMKKGDTLTVKFASSIDEVCTKKGCWMKLSLNDEAQTMVRFKDYGFFMPLDSKGNEVIVEGKAFINETSVDELRHYAEDAGKTKEEIEQIIEPKKEFTFLAHGVLMK